VTGHAHRVPRTGAVTPAQPPRIFPPIACGSRQIVPPIDGLAGDATQLALDRPPVVQQLPKLAQVVGCR